MFRPVAVFTDVWIGSALPGQLSLGALPTFIDFTTFIMKPFFTLLLLSLLSTPLLIAQPSEPGRDCDSEPHQAELMLDPEYATGYHERHARMKALLLERQEGNRAADCVETVRLPMAFHFQGVSASEVECLRELAIGQLQILNDDFQGVNADINLWSGTNGSSQNHPGASNGESCIQFCLPTTGHPTGFGIAEGDPAVTINETSGSFSGAWSGYINVYVRNIGALGFSPLGGQGNGDGVTVDIGAFGAGAGCSGVVPGAPFDLGRTLTHELGHYLDLAHIWGGGCGQDDGVADTPNQSSSYGGCPSNTASSCGSTDMHMSYMDYVNDRCMYMFSAGQVAIMDAYASANLQNVINNPATCGDTGGGGGGGNGGGPTVLTVEFGETEFIIDEGTVGCDGGEITQVVVPLTISGAPEEDVSVTVALTGTATEGEDYSVAATTVVFPAGQTDDRVITFEIEADNLAEDDEFIELNFAVSATGGNVEAGEQTFAYIALTNDDTALSPNSDIQTEANDQSGFAFFDFGPFATVDFFDQNTGAIMLTLINQSGHDYGCTQVLIDRGSGNDPGATESPAAQAAFLTDKTFFISPENNSFNDAYQVRLYYTADEIAGFLDEAGQPSWNLRMFNSGNFIGDATELAEADATMETFGDNSYFEASLSGGLSGLAVGVASATLPVEMTTFTATATEKTIDLNWTTVLEENNQGFDVTRRSERSAAFVAQGWVPASGNAGGSDYTFVDRTAVAGQQYFYQLLQRDLDGTETASAIVAATMAGNTGRVSAYPNPSGDRLTVSIATEAAGNLRLTGTDGRLIAERSFGEGGTTKVLNLTEVPPGVYLLVVETATETLVRKIVRK